MTGRRTWRRWPRLAALVLAGLLAAPAIGEEGPVGGAEAAGAGAEARVLIVYYSVEGHTRAMAEAVAAGAGSVAGVTVRLVEVEEARIEDVVAADAIVLGSPVYNANVAPPMQSFINRWPFDGDPLRDKIGAAFATGGGISAGEEAVQLSLLRSMLVFGMIVVGGPEWTGAFGASAVTGEEPFDRLEEGAVAPRFLEKGRRLGRRVAALALRLRRAANVDGEARTDEAVTGDAAAGGPRPAPEPVPSPSLASAPETEARTAGDGPRRAVGLWSALLVLGLAAAAHGSTGDGDRGSALRPCPRTPNCVSSQATDDRHSVEPFEPAIDPQAAWARVREAVESLPRTRIVSAEEGYLRAECRSALLGFVDDLELRLDPAGRRIDVRSASRTGRWDLGVNRQRVEDLRRLLRESGAIR